MIPYIYTRKFLVAAGLDPAACFAAVFNETPWVRIENTPRYECWMAPQDYTYGTQPHARTYVGNPTSPTVALIQKALEQDVTSSFDGCFLNRYDGSRDHLGWHADDSPEMDDDRPIAVVSLGREREIWFRPKGAGGEATHKLVLHAGSLLIMPPGMQDAWEHRIPKDSRQSDETRISLTFRGLV